MRRGELRLILGVLVLIALALVLRHDLAMLAWRQGNDSLRSGDYRAALASFEKAGRGELHARQIAFDTGVACYRLGEFQQAREQFAAASASDDPGIRAAAHFNMGNCDFRQGERLAATDRNASRSRFQQAAEEYGKALAIASDAADVRHNLSVVRKRLADHLRDAGRDSRRKGGRAGSQRSGKGAAGKPQENQETAGQSESSGGQPTGRGRESTGRSPGVGWNAPATPGKGEPRLTRDEAERLLSDARRREARPLPAPGDGAAGRLSRPDKDW